MASSPNGWCACGDGSPTRRKTDAGIDVCAKCNGVPRATVKQVSRSYHSRHVAELLQEEEALARVALLTPEQRATVQGFLAAVRDVPACILDGDEDHLDGVLEALDGLLDRAASHLEQVRLSLAVEKKFLAGVDASDTRQFACKEQFMTPTTKDVKAALEFLQRSIHQTAVAKGWWNDHNKLKEAVRLYNEGYHASPESTIASNLPDVLFRTAKSMLCVSEIAEGVEALRNNDAPDDKLPQFPGQAVEMADDIIRQLDLAARFNLPVIDALIAKMEFNIKRAYMHGGKAI